MLANLLEAVDDGHAGDAVDAGQRVEADGGEIVLARHLAKVDDGLGRGVDAQHRLRAGLLVALLVVVRHDELVVVLAPREHVAPVAEIVGDDGQTVAPRLDHGLDVVQRPRPRLQQALVDLRRFLQLHHLCGPNVDVFID